MTLVPRDFRCNRAGAGIVFARRASISIEAMIIDTVSPAGDKHYLYFTDCFGRYSNDSPQINATTGYLEVFNCL